MASISKTVKIIEWRYTWGRIRIKLECKQIVTQFLLTRYVSMYESNREIFVFIFSVYFDKKVVWKGKK